MKKLTADQRSVIHGGGALVGLIYGATALMGSVSLAHGLFSRLISKGGDDLRSPEPEIAQDPKTFTNQIRSKIIILS